MRTFIQLRDGIGFATLQVAEGEPDHTVTPDHTTAIEVFTTDPDEFLGKKYITETKSWIEAPVIKYAIINEVGFPIEICKTVYEHDCKGPILSEDMLERPDLLHTYKWENNEWISTYTPDVTVESIPQEELPAPEIYNGAPIVTE